jgi:hypothetical protein
MQQISYKWTYRITSNNRGPQVITLTKQFSQGKQHKNYMQTYVTHEEIIVARNMHNSGPQLTTAPKIRGRYNQLIHTHI